MKEEVEKTKSEGGNTISIKIEARPKIKGKRRRPVEWTESETDALIRGVRKWGVGNWRLIYERSEDKFDYSRRPIDLYEKYRCILKNLSYTNAKKSIFYEVDENEEPIKESNGKVKEYKSKFPYDVARMRAKRRKLNKGEVCTIRIGGVVLGGKCFHVYQAYIDSESGKLCIFKIAGKSVLRRDGI